jgi:hypothetical protein
MRDECNVKSPSEVGKQDRAFREIRSGGHNEDRATEHAVRTLFSEVG